MNKEFDSISIADLFWVQFKNDRVSFRIKGLPDDIHFTIAWHSDSPKINLHISRNTSAGSNKPKIVIAEIKKELLPELYTFIPVSIFNSLFQAVSFNNNSRKLRKSIRLCFFDDMEKQDQHVVLEE